MCVFCADMPGFLLAQLHFQLIPIMTTIMVHDIRDITYKFRKVHQVNYGSYMYVINPQLIALQHSLNLICSTNTMKGQLFKVIKLNLYKVYKRSAVCNYCAKSTMDKWFCHVIQMAAEITTTLR